MFSKIKKQVKEILNRLNQPSKVEEFSSTPESQSEMVEFYSQFIKSEDLCFDIGANTGERTDIFLSLGAKVVCIEPQAECVTILKKKYSENSQVSIVQKGLDEQPGIRQLSVCEAANTISTFSEKWKKGRFHDQKWETRIDVSMTTLDELIQEFGIPVFIKIDVEGFEYQVLKGLSSAVPMLSFEFTKEFIDDVKLCMNYLKSIGKVEFNYTLGESPTLSLPRWSDAEIVFDTLNQIKNNSLWGDIYASFLISS